MCYNVAGRYNGRPDVASSGETDYTHLKIIYINTTHTHNFLAQEFLVFRSRRHPRRGRCRHLGSAAHPALDSRPCTTDTCFVILSILYLSWKRSCYRKEQERDATRDRSIRTSRTLFMPHLQRLIELSVFPSTIFHFFFLLYIFSATYLSRVAYSSDHPRPI